MKEGSKNSPLFYVKNCIACAFCIRTNEFSSFLTEDIGGDDVSPRLIGCAPEPPPLLFIIVGPPPLIDAVCSSFVDFRSSDARFRTSPSCLALGESCSALGGVTAGIVSRFVPSGTGVTGTAVVGSPVGGTLFKFVPSGAGVTGIAVVG